MAILWECLHESQPPIYDNHERVGLAGKWREGRLVFEAQPAEDDRLLFLLAGVLLRPFFDPVGCEETWQYVPIHLRGAGV